MVRIQLTTCTCYTNHAENEGIDPASTFAETMTAADDGGDYEGGDVDDELDDGDPAAGVVHG